MKISYYWTRQISQTLEKKIMACFDRTFNRNSSKNYFKWKYRNNPFGDSLHIIALDKKKVVASRAFWRLDVNKTEAYQCVDTAVLPKFQNKGIFKKTALIATKILKKKLIYNSPNKNSGPAYLKCGWKNISNSNLTKINITFFMLKSSPEISWCFKTLEWRYKKNPNQKYYNLKKGQNYYIFREIRKRFFLLVGKTNINLNLPNINPFICFTYDYSCLGLPFRFRQSWMCKNKVNYKFKSYLFDET
jgi:hypothetical protein